MDLDVPLRGLVVKGFHDGKEKENLNWCFMKVERQAPIVLSPLHAKVR